MSYRRSNSTDVESSKWRLANQSLLGECGVPIAIASSDRRWIYLLLHGEEEVSGWAPSWISPKQASKLFKVLEQELPNPIGYGLLPALNKRAAANKRLKTDRQGLTA